MHADTSAKITLRTLITARWVLVALLATAAAVTTSDVAILGRWLPSPPPPGGLAALLVAWSAVNVATTRFGLRASEPAVAALAGIHLLIDAAAITALLALSGGATNPFTSLYFVPITLATQVSTRWTWSLAGFCLACFAALFVLQPMPTQLVPPGSQGHFAGHLRGMWVAFGVSGALITVFVHRIAASLARQRTELGLLREQALRDRHLAALGSLAAGAAHELGTPLGTVQLLVSDMARMSAAERDDAIATAKRQITRCKTIVHSMRSPQLSMQVLGSDVAWELADIEQEFDTAVDTTEVQVVVDAATRAQTTQPQYMLGQILRELIANARAACRRAGGGKIRVSIRDDGSNAQITVHDDGDGMTHSVAARAFDPFFSTKDEGQGMGLGLYLVQAQLQQLGGNVRLCPTDKGTKLQVRLPLGAELLRDDKPRAG